MNVFHRVTLQTMKRNRLRTLVTIIGVILSTAMVCAVTTSVASLRDYLIRGVVEREGDWYARVDAASGAESEALLQDSRVTQLASAQLVGYAEISSENIYKPYVYVMGVDGVFFDSMPVHVMQGRLPETPDELLLPLHLLTNGHVDVRLGQTLQLALGNRVMDGEALPQSVSYQEGETFVPERERTYSVVGFYERAGFEDYSAPGYVALTCPDDAGPDEYCLYYKTRSASDAEAPAEALGLNAAQNWDLLAYSGRFRYANVTRMLVNFAGILIFLIALGSISLIYSAFSISVSQRTRQFGILSSVGATRRQLRGSVFFEALVVSAVGIPLGVAAGICGMGVTLHFVGDKFRGILQMDVPMTLRVSWASVAAAAVIALVTVLISAWIPAGRATRITAMDAIRQSREVRAKERDVHVSRLTRRMFGLEGLLAKKYFFRARRRYRATIVSLVLSLVLFISSSAFGMYLTRSVGETLNTKDFDVYVDMTYGADRLEAVLTGLRTLPEVTSASGLRTYYTTAVVSREQLDESYLDYLKRDAISAAADPDYTGGIAMRVVICGLDRASYDRFCTEQGIPVDSSDPVVCNSGRAVWYEKTESGELTRRVSRIRYLKSDVTSLPLRTEQTVEGWEYQYTTQDIELGENGNVTACGGVEDVFERPDDAGEAILRLPVKTEPLELRIWTDALPGGLTDSGGMVLLYPMDRLPAVQAAEDYAFITSISRNHAETARNAEGILMEQGCYSGSAQVADMREEEESSRNVVTVINVFSYGFITLISLISAANVFNTVSTNVVLRRREFAVLRSVGMTQRGLNRMMNYECALYGCRALAFGLPLSFMMTFFTYRAAGEGVSSRFLIPWGAVGVAVFSVFAVVFATMLYAVRRIRREPPIDALKDDNLI